MISLANHSQTEYVKVVITLIKLIKKTNNNNKLNEPDHVILVHIAYMQAETAHLNNLIRAFVTLIYNVGTQIKIHAKM